MTAVSDCYHDGAENRISFFEIQCNAPPRRKGYITHPLSKLSIWWTSQARPLPRGDHEVGLLFTKRVNADKVLGTRLAKNRIMSLRLLEKKPGCN